MRKAFSLAILGFFVTACDTAGSLPSIVDPIQDESSSSSSRSLEQVPSELSVEYFSTMTLDGSDFVLENVESRTDSYVRHAIGFRSNGLYISGILNIPLGDGPFPLIVLNHGYIDPKVYTRGRGLKREQDYFSRRGFAVLHVDYRGHAASDPSPDDRKIYDAGLEYSMDVMNGIQALKKANLPNIDTDHIGMLGHSMGGGITQNILDAYPELVDAAVLYASVHGDAWENFHRWRRERDEDDRTETLGSPEENPGAWNALSASSFYDRIRTPVLVFHGANDSDVPKAWSDTLVRRLRQLKKDVTYVEYPSERHEFVSEWSDFMQKSLRFFQEQNADQPAWIMPLEQDRITLKSFGTFVTPTASPIPQERFSGYHTGADFELREGENPYDVEVQSACTGPMVLKKFVNGYGGLVLQECLFHGEAVTVLYGHVRLSSVNDEVGSILTRGIPFAVLGEADSRETDGERAHLHFSVHRGESHELRGYVSEKEDLQSWLDPTVMMHLP